MLEELQQRPQEIDKPATGEKETSPRHVVERALVQLENNQERRRYDEYRLDECWQRRQATATRLRPYRRAG